LSITIIIMDIDYTKLNSFIRDLSTPSDDKWRVTHAHKVDPTTIGICLLTMMSETIYQETLDDLSCIYEIIHNRLNDIYDDDIDYIMQLRGDLADQYYQYVWDEEPDYDDLVAQEKGYNPKLFLRAITNLRNDGLKVYVTNWGKFRTEIWDEYKRIMFMIEP